MHNQPQKFILRDWLQRILVFVGYYESNREMLINFFDTMPNHVLFYEYIYKLILIINNIIKKGC